MKRISLLLTLSALVPGLCQGYCSSSRYQVRYSPYALSYRSSGLIPGGMDYSPHALRPGHSGLVYESTRYTPYALSYDNSGLIVDYYWWQRPVCPVQVIAVPCPPPGAYSAQRSSNQMRPTTSDERATDAMYVIRNYLAGLGFKSIDINYRWSKDNRTASVSFILHDKGLAIRYTDPQVVEVQSFASSSGTAAVEKNRQTWETFARSFQAGGGSVYTINASGSDQIVAALDACRALHPQDDIASEAVLYAKN